MAWRDEYITPENRTQLATPNNTSKTPKHFITAARVIDLFVEVG